MTQRARFKKNTLCIYMHAIDNNGCFVQEIYARAWIERNNSYAPESKAYKRRDNAIERIIDAARVN